MISLYVDASGPLGAVNDMIAKLRNFPQLMAQELTDWQVEDMNRTKNTNTALKGNTAETIITQRKYPPRVRQPT